MPFAEFWQSWSTVITPAGRLRLRLVVNRDYHRRIWAFHTALAGLARYFSAQKERIAITRFSVSATGVVVGHHDEQSSAFQPVQYRRSPGHDCLHGYLMLGTIATVRAKAHLRSSPELAATGA